MKVIIITPFDGETSIQRGKTRITEATATIFVDGETYKEVYFRICTGQVLKATVNHVNFTNEMTKALSSWWYEVNFGDKFCEIGVEYEIEEQ